MNDNNIHSTSPQDVNEKDDEAALIDSLFMPGGILNPFLEDNADTASLPSSGGLGVVEGTTSGVMVDNLSQDQGMNRGDSFWSGGVLGAPASGGLSTDAVDVHGERLWPIASTSTPINDEDPGAAVITESLFGSNGVNQTSNTSRPLEHTSTNIHDSDGTIPTSLFGYDNPHALNSMDKAVAELESPFVPSLHNLVSTSPPPAGLIVPTQEEEDVRQMIQALSSTLQQQPNIPLDPPPLATPTEQQPRIQPDSPPKIIRQRSSISDNHRKNTQVVAVASDTLLPATDARNNGIDLMDHLSTTSSLSSGSAQPKEPQQTHLRTSSIPPLASTSLLGDPTGLLPFQPQEQAREPPILEPAQVPPPSAFLLSPATLVSPPPGYDSFQQHQKNQHSAMPTPAAVTSPQQRTLEPPLGFKNHPSYTNPARQGPIKQGIGSQQQQQQHQPLSYSAVSRRPGANKASSSLSPSAIRTSAAYKPLSRSQSEQPKQSQIMQSSQQHPPRKAVSKQNTPISFTNNAPAPVPPKNVSSSPLPTVSPKQRKQSRKQQQQQNPVTKPFVIPTKTKPNRSNSKKVLSYTSQQQTEPQRQSQPLQDESVDASVSTNSSLEEDNANTNDSSTVSARGGINTIRAPNGDSNDSAIRFAATSQALGNKQQRYGAPSNQDRQWSERALSGLVLFLRLVQFGGKLISCLMQEAVKEATEQKAISAYYILLYMTPTVSLFLIDLSVWLPHYFPGVTMAAVLWWICRRIVNETDPSLLLEAEASLAYQSMSPEDQAAHHSSTHAAKKKTRSATSRQQPHSHSNNSSQNRDPVSSEAARLRVLHSIEAKICYGLVRNLRWSLPLLVFVHSVVGPPAAPPLWDEEASGENLLPSIRLVAAFGLAVLKTHNILSPVAWASGAIQILCVLSMQNTQSYMERWCGLEIIVTALGLTALRFMRLHGATTTTSSSSTALSTLGGHRQKYL